VQSYSVLYNLAIKAKSELLKIWKIVKCQIRGDPSRVLKIPSGKEISARETHIFYALWASKFFNYVRQRQISSDSYQENVVCEYLEALKSEPHLSDWQIMQAGDAIRLFYFYYWGLKPVHLPAIKAGDSAPALIKETTRLLRLKHYSYSTERTYLQ
jgi:hypothetical protein